MPFNRRGQGNLMQNTENFPYFKLFCIVSKQIQDKKDLKLQQHNQSKSQGIKIEQDADNKGSSLQRPLQSASSAFIPFNGVEYQDLFAQEDCYQQWRPPNIVNKISFISQTQILFKSLKKKSYFRHIIPKNTLVFAKYNDFTIWPGIVVNFRVLESSKTIQTKRVLYDIDLINKNHIQRQLGKCMLVKFNGETVGMLREFAKDNKQLLKALKVTEKLHQQNKGKRRDNSKKYELKQDVLNPKIVKTIILKGEQHLKTTKLQEKFKNNRVQKYDKELIKSQYLVLKKNNSNKKTTKKWKSLNLLIQTPKVSLSQFASLEENQSDPQSQIENSDHQSVDKYKSNGKNQQYDNSDETHFSEYDENGIEINPLDNTKDYSNGKLIDKAIRYLQNLKLRVERQVKKSKKYERFSQVFDLLDRSFQDFNQLDVSKYSNLVKLSIQIGLKKLPPSHHKNKTVMQQLRQKLCRLYLTLDEYKGTNVIVSKLSQTLITLLEPFYATVSTERQT